MKVEKLPKANGYNSPKQNIEITLPSQTLELLRVSITLKKRINVKLFSYVERTL